MIVEQPGSSLLARHPRFQELCEHIKAMREISTMYRFHRPIPTLRSSGNASTRCADLANLVLDGPLRPSDAKEDIAVVKLKGHSILLERKDDQKVPAVAKEKNKRAGFKPVVQYKDRKGRRRYHGTPQLTQTQKPGSMHRKYVAS